MKASLTHTMLSGGALALLSFGGAALLLGGCSDDGTTCGPGTVLDGDTCVVAPTSSSSGGGMGQGGDNAGGGGNGTGGISAGGNGGAGGTIDPTPMFAGATALAPASATSVLVTWNAASDDVTPPEGIRYHVYVADSSGGQDLSTPDYSVTGATSLQLSGLTAGTTYYAVVRAEDEDGNQDANSAEVSGAPSEDTTAPTFAGVASAGRASVTQVQVQWQAASDDLSAPDAISYGIYFAPVGGNLNPNTPDLLTAPGATSALVTVPDGGDYMFGVRAFDAAGNGDSNTATTVAAASPDTNPPTFNGCMSALVTGASSSYIGWLAGTDDATPSSALSYHVYASTTPGGQDFGSPTATFIGGQGGEVTGLDANNTYYFACRAADAAGNLSADNQVQVSTTTLPDSTPPIFAGASNITNAATDSLEIVWNAANDDTTAAANIVYDLYVATSSGGQNFATADATSAAGATSHVLTSLTPGTFYYVVVRARDTAGNQETNTAQVSLRTLVAFSQVQSIFTTSCATSSCHAGTNAVQGLRLDSEFFSYQSLCGNGVATTCTPVQAVQTAVNRIQPGNPSSSWVYQKLTNTHGGIGESMPPPSCGTCSPVSPANQALISDWITQGAAKL